MRELLGDYTTFIENISRGLEEVGIERNEVPIMDHLCYRVETRARYAELLKSFGKSAILLGESEVMGRTIATFEFHDYLSAAGWTVPYLELPEPKESSPYPEGLEHAELVVLGSLNRFAELHRELPFETKGMIKKLNPELGLKTDVISVKFHEQSLGAVVLIEQRLGLT